MCCGIMTQVHCVLFRPLGNLLWAAASQLNSISWSAVVWFNPGLERRRGSPASCVSFGIWEKSKSLPGLWQCVEWTEDIASWATWSEANLTLKLLPLLLPWDFPHSCPVPSHPWPQQHRGADVLCSEWVMEKCDTAVTTRWWRSAD